MIQGGSGELGVRIDGVGSHATVTGNELGSSIVQDGASATFADNRFIGEALSPWSTCLLAVELTDGEVVVRGNRFDGGRQGICTIDAGALEIAENTFSDADLAGVSLSGGQAHLTANTMRESALAISLSDGAAALEDNIVGDNGIGLMFLGAAKPALEGNDICGNGTNLMANGVQFEDLGGNDICEDAPDE